MTAGRAAHLTASALLTVAMLALGTPGAWAHGSNGNPIPDSAHYLSQITAINPPTPGLSASIDPRGEWIEVANTNGQTLTILGYAHEPYLQITPAGVAENLSSPTRQLNQSLFADLSQLGASSPALVWQQTSTANHVRWHDHRIHWMSAERPPAVKAQPRVGHLIGPWTIHMTLADQPVDLAGSLSWLPIKRSTNWFLIWFFIGDVLALAGAAGIGAWFLRRNRKRGSGPDPAAPNPDSNHGHPPRTAAAALPPEPHGVECPRAQAQSRLTQGSAVRREAQLRGSQPTDDRDRPAVRPSRPSSRPGRR
jgi:hypothetical protein